MQRCTKKTIKNIVSDSPFLSIKDYIQGKFRIHVHWNLCQLYGITSEKAGIGTYQKKLQKKRNHPWDMRINADKEIKINRPDTDANGHHEKKNSFVIDVSIITDDNVFF